VSYESKNKTTGDVGHPYSTHPVGRITYDAAGRMSAILMNPDRERVGGSSSGGSIAATRLASAEDMRAMLSGFIAYFGTFDVDESAKTVIHHVEACLIPSWVGTDLRRAYEFEGNDQLTLSADLAQIVARIVWKREVG